MKAHHMSFTTIFYVSLSSACTNILSQHSLKLLTFMKTWRFGYIVLPKRPDGDAPGNLQLYLVKSSRIPLTWTVVHLFCNILKNNLIPIMHHYSIYYPHTFLRILVFGYPVSNIAINSSTSSRASNICVTPFSLQFLTSYGLRIIFSEPSIGTTKSSVIGHTDVLWIGNMVTGPTMNITQTHPNKSHS